MKAKLCLLPTLDNAGSICSGVEFSRIFARLTEISERAKKQGISEAYSSAHVPTQMGRKMQKFALNGDKPRLNAIQKLMARPSRNPQLEAAFLADMPSIAPQSRARTAVRRHSRAAGRCEGTFWRRTNRQEVRTILAGAKRFELAGRERGQRSGPLGSVAIELLELLANLVDFKTGRLEPALETMMRLLRRSKDAVVRALKNLRSHGFLDWLRRYEPTYEPGRGPQVKQTSNAYRLSLPAAASRLLGFSEPASPAPVDLEHARAQAAAELRAQLDALAPADRAAAILGSSLLADSLKRLGLLLGERESAGRSESQPNIK